MKNNISVKKIFVCALICLTLTSCGGKKDFSAEADTMATKLLAVFEKEIASSKDLMKVAEAVTSSPACDVECVVSEITAGPDLYLPGFDSVITEFNTGVSFMPMIGSIPFVGYIFESDNPELLKEKLLKESNPRWNICTQAAETVCSISGKYVFFTMCPGDED